MSSGPTYIYLPLLFSLCPERVALRWRLALFPGCTAATRWVIYSWMTQMPHISTWLDPRLETPVPGRPTMGGMRLPGEQDYVDIMGMFCVRQINSAPTSEPLRQTVGHRQRSSTAGPLKVLICGPQRLQHSQMVRLLLFCSFQDQITKNKK